ncbi:MAG: hypothetical protein K2F75_01495, partial [Paramuribaculum sp.]|nr:hypothetical protein [Paramuribaculum sp.]
TIKKAARKKNQKKNHNANPQSSELFLILPHNTVSPASPRQERGRHSGFNGRSLGELAYTSIL